MTKLLPLALLGVTLFASTQFAMENTDSGIILASEIFTPQEYESLEKGNKKSIPKKAYNAARDSYLNGNHQTTWKKITYSSDGLKISGFLLHPHVLEEDKKYPCIYFCPGGSSIGNFAKITVNDFDLFDAFVRAGFVVLATQYRGRDESEGEDQLGGDDVNDILNLERVAKNLEFTDMDNQFLCGFCRGSMMALLAIKRGMKVNAVATKGTLSNLTTIEDEWPWLEQHIFRKLIPDTQSKRERKKAYKERSAVFWPKKVTAPLMMLHGKNDLQTKEYQARKLFDAMAHVEKVSLLLQTFPNENHKISKYQRNQSRIHDGIIEWFCKYKNK